MKYTAKQRPNGTWAVFTGRKYFVDTVTKDPAKAKIAACHMSAAWHRTQIDMIHACLEDMGAVDPQDAYGYLA